MTRVPRVTVVIPVWNGEATVQAAARSVLTGTHDDLELIIVDDGSTDGSRASAASIEDPRVRVLQTPHGGVSRARNAGAAAATGELLAFLDADDEADPGWLDGLLALFGPGVGLVTCGYRAEGAAESRAGQGPHYLAGTWVTSREVFDAVGGYDPELAYGENYELAYRIRAHLAERGMSTARTARPLLTYRKVVKPLAAAGVRARVRAAETMLERHSDQLGPREQANFHRISGVGYVRLGDRRRGMAELRQAARLSGLRSGDAVRVLVARVPPLARRVWGRADED